MIQIKKSSGEYQKFNEEKLVNSLTYTGATPAQIDEILKEINNVIYEGMPTHKIFSLAFKNLRKVSRPLSAYYGTKRALLELGPDGFLFEKFVARLFTKMGYNSITNVVIEGNCVEHEVDVVADSPSEKLLIECKFHGSKDRKNDLKAALYIKARSLDIMDGPVGEQYDDFWLISNTSFSEDAIRYATCAGLRLWGANFPPQNTLQDVVREMHLDPITCLSSLRKGEKRMLLDSEIIVTEDLQKSPQVLKDIGLSQYRINRVLNEISKL